MLGPLKWLNPLRWLTLLVLLALVALVIASAVLFVFPDEDRVGRAGAVYVLAGGKERLGRGLELVRRGVARTLVIDDGRNPDWPEANRVCNRRQSFEVICFRADPFSTRGEAQAIRRLARQRGWRAVVVVTSTYHVTRTRMLMRRCLPTARVVAARPPVRRWALGVVYEWPKLVVALVRRSC
jgi:uncharacterized SAM-binding protein YcdF (DUF218 family)